MNPHAHVALHFKGIHPEDNLQALLENHCQRIADEFHETNHLELTLSLEAGEITAHAHASGKQTQIAAHAHEPDARKAGDLALDRLERELRRRHDKRIFSSRRAARKDRQRRPSLRRSSSQDQV